MGMRAEVLLTYLSYICLLSYASVKFAVVFVQGGKMTLKTFQSPDTLVKQIQDVM